MKLLLALPAVIAVPILAAFDVVMNIITIGKWGKATGNLSSGVSRIIK